MSIAGLVFGGRTGGHVAGAARAHEPVSAAARHRARPAGDGPSETRETETYEIDTFDLV